MYTNLLPRFLKFVKIETRSDASSSTIPSTQSQVEFAKMLVETLKEIGMSEVTYNESNGFVMATLPSNSSKENVRTIGFIAHMDTANFNAKDIKPQFVENYDGVSDIKLNDEFKLTVKEFPNLANYKGQTLITTDGTTLLGADDKAGIAEILSAMEYLIKNPDIKHGKIRLAFGPDEEIGIGADKFDVKEFGADFAYTLDGGPLGELQYETFNAASAKVEIQGKNVHPGTAKNIMVNALELAIKFHTSLPSLQIPSKTEKYEGFFHLEALNGNVDAAKLTYIIRDHDRVKFEHRKELMQDIARQLNEELGEERIKLTLKDSYYNMSEVIKNDMSIVDLAKNAMENLGIKPIIEPVRGGTDGSKISFMGIPTPNLFAGGENFHGRYEFISVQSMEKAVDTIVEIVKLEEKNA